MLGSARLNADILLAVQYVATGATHCTALDIGINSTGTKIMDVPNPGHTVSHPEGIILRSVKVQSCAGPATSP